MSEARMQETGFAPGTFCWIELGTSDGEAAKKFYTELFGWSFTDNPMGPNMVYTMLKQDGKEVGALYNLDAEMKSAGVPPHWMSYLSVANADQIAKKAKDAGATLMKEPFDVMDFGRMAVVQDPTGAMFSLWQAGTHPGIAIYNVPNSLCWNELSTTDTEKAGEFYSNVFGWTRNVQQFGPMSYTTFRNNERPAGGMYQPGPEMGDVPPHWLPYFAVDDCDAMVEKAVGLGAKSCAPPMDIAGTGRFAPLLDPQGAAFAVIKLINPQT
ncbi:MAG TPA: VOC family protein [Pyrinomonadaceae bacterium]|nr:VOC family protein [Pyrinomonadaceae bacterium]